MSLTQLNIHHLRNITSMSFSPHARFNIIYGENGSGKTSLLESIYLLSRGHSFRTRETSPLIQQAQSTLTIFAQTEQQTSISIQKNASGSTQVKIDRQFCKRSSDLAHILPCQIFYQDIFQIVDAGPSVRRNILDWGLFHVKQSYAELWRDYHRALKQRNTLLRQKTKVEQLTPWNKILSELADKLHAARHAYFQAWSSKFQEVLSHLSSINCQMDYDKGWDRRHQDKSLETILNEQLASDLQQQYTRSGAHQADIHFMTEHNKAKQTLSRGQQKIILFALKLAQAQLLSKHCIYLFDDVASELDNFHLHRVLTYLNQLQGQFFLTATEPERLISVLPQNEHALFYLQQGNVSRETETTTSTV